MKMARHVTLYSWQYAYIMCCVLAYIVNYRLATLEHMMCMVIHYNSSLSVTTNDISIVKHNPLGGSSFQQRVRCGLHTEAVG